MKSIESSLGEALNGVTGSSLLKVVYQSLKYETTRVELEQVPTYIGGEVGLNLSGHKTLHCSWAENAGWTDHFSLQIREHSHFIAGSLEEHDASEFPLWRPHIGKVLVSWRVLGLNSTPHVIELRFAEKCVYIGDGYQSVFGDGDDVVISNTLGDEGNAIAWVTMLSSTSQ
jgi:hypothetical protein